MTLSICGPATAAVLVKSGDHDGFTRLVVYFEPGQDWEIDRTEQGYQLTAPDLGEGYDISNVFSLISRDRLASLAASDDILALELSCDCGVTTEVLATGHLVLDISKDPPADEPPFVEQPQLDDPVVGDPLTALRAERSEIKLPPRTATPVLQNPPPAPDQVEELSEFRRRLLENLGRSASLSLVDLVENEDATRLTPVAEPNLAVSGPELDQRARVTNAVDDALRRAVSQVQPTQRTSCPDPAAFDIAAWGDPDGFSYQISKHRRAVVQEFDRVDQAQVLQLAKAYLHYGLVEEARHVLSQFDLPASSKDALFVLARIMDNTGSGVELETFSHCEGTITPWLVLDAPRTVDLTETRGQNLASEFAGWPASLQKQLGPRLISALDRRGRDTTASVLASILAGGSSRASADSVAQDLPLAEVLEEVTDGSEGSIAAMAAFLRKAIDEGALIEDEHLELAAAFEREAVGLPISDELFALRLEAIAYRGEVKALIAELDRSGAQLPDPAYNQIAAHIIDSNVPDAVARFAIFAARAGILNRLQPDLIVELATRLSASGLPELAQSTAMTGGVKELPPVLAAELADAQGKVDEAVILLGQTNVPEASKQLAHVLLKNARAGQLPDAAKAALPNTLKDRVAWASADWDNVGGDGETQAVSELIVDLQNTDLSQAPLTTAKAIQSKSAEARALLANILNAPDP